MSSKLISAGNSHQKKRGGYSSPFAVQLVWLFRGVAVSRCACFTAWLFHGVAVSRRGCFAAWVGVLVARQCGDTRGCMLASFHDAVAVVKLAPAAHGAHTTGANGR